MNSQIQYHYSTDALAHVSGFTTSAAACDIRNKGNDRLDLCLIHSATPCTAAGVFTTNDVVAAPVTYCQDVLAEGTPIHGIICNSGNANACTGEQGDRDAEKMLIEAERQTQSPEKSYLVCSTGRIGEVLPMDRMVPKIQECAQNLSTEPQNATDAAESILTSDTRPKTVRAEFTLDGEKVTIAGIAKGAGMIEPNMATMLAFVITDADVETSLLHKLITDATNQSFNRLTVDGDMSTNDAVLLLANGQSGKQISPDIPEGLQLFQEALNQICYDLAHKIVSDGERITKVVKIHTTGAPSDLAAEKVCRAVGNSLLVKTSWYGNDPNWGRLMDAAGYARVGLQMEKIDLHYDETPVLLQGKPQTQNRADWKSIVSGDSFSIHLDLNLGAGKSWILSTDLTEGYVDFNKSE